MDIALIPVRGRPAATGIVDLARMVDRLGDAVSAAEGAFARLLRTVSEPVASAAAPDLADAIEAERTRLSVIKDANDAYRRSGPLIDMIGARHAEAAATAESVWNGFGDRLADTFAGLFDTVARDGEVSFRALFDSLSPLLADLIRQMSGVDVGGVLEAIGPLLGGGASPVGGIAQLLPAVLNLAGPLLGASGGGLGGLLGGAGGLVGSISGIPGLNVVAAALPLILGQFADRDYPFARAGIAAADGRLTRDVAVLDGGPGDRVAALAGQVVDMLGQVLDGLGARIGDLADLTVIGYASGRKSVLPTGFFAGIDDRRSGDFASGAVFAGLQDPGEAVLRAVQSGLLRALETGTVGGLDDRRAETVQIGLQRALAGGFTTLQAGLDDLGFLAGFDDRIARLNAEGDVGAVQRLEIDRAAEARGADDAALVREFLERSRRLFAPVETGDRPAAETGSAGPSAAPEGVRYLTDESTQVGIDDRTRVPITDESTLVGYRTVGDAAPAPIPEPVDDAVFADGAVADRIAEAEAAVRHYVQALLGLDDVVSDTAPLTGYARQLAETEARIEGLDGALREAGFSAEETAELLRQGKDAARDRLREAFEDDLDAEIRAASGLDVVDQVGALVEGIAERRREAEALGADAEGLDRLLGLQVRNLVAGGGLSLAAIDALRTGFADNAVVMDALSASLDQGVLAANDNAAAQLTLADVTRMATRELDTQVRAQEEVRRTAERASESLADARERLALDGRLSIYDPREQLDQARLLFEDLAARARSGDQAAQLDLADAGERYLGLAREFYASNEDYARIFRQVDAALRDAGGTADRQLDVAERQLEELRGLRRDLTGDLDDLPNPDADFGAHPTRNRLIARITGYAGDFGAGGFNAFRGGLSDEINALVENLAATVGFADGGVMTGHGPLRLERYAAGGIARAPQVALFGEGRRPEAYVPLPDGRTIPVTVAGSGDPDDGADRRTAALDALLDETRRLRTEVAGLRAENAALARGIDRLAARRGATGRAA